MPGPNFPGQRFLKVSWRALIGTIKPRRPLDEDVEPLSEADPAFSSELRSLIDR